jgi:Spy/CpxP family protein refolding chaperone
MKKMFLTLCVVLLFGSVVSAQGPMMGYGDPEGPITEIPSMPAGKWWRIPEVAAQLSLTPKEQAKLDELFVENQRKIIDLRGAWAKEKFELEQLLEKKDIDDAACMAQFKKMIDKRSGIVTERFRHVLDVIKLLGHDRFQMLKTQARSQRDLKMKEMRDMRRIPENVPPSAPPGKK